MQNSKELVDWRQVFNKLHYSEFSRCCCENSIIKNKWRKAKKEILSYIQIEMQGRIQRRFVRAGGGLGGRGRYQSNPSLNKILFSWEIWINSG